MATLGKAGLQLDGKVAEYLASGQRSRRVRLANANDDVLATEIGGLPPPSWYAAGARRSADRVAAAPILFVSRDLPPYGL